jgi:hypothetical protein
MDDELPPIPDELPPIPDAVPPIPDAPPAATDAATQGSVGKGVLIGFLSQLILIPVAPLALGIAIVQLAYILPISIYFRRRNEMLTVKGLYIAAGVVALLNVACWGVIIVSLSNADFR